MNIIITGNSKGIGLAISKKWSMIGAINNYMNHGYYAISRTNNIDVTNYNEIGGFIREIFTLGQRPIALVNNAGIIKMGTILETNEKDWKDQFDVNVNGIFHCSKAYIEACIKHNVKGKIINIASTAGLGARPGRSVYSATKAAIINFSLSLAEEVKEYGIKIYCVCPSAVDTDMRHYICPDDDFNSMVKPNEVADFICNLIIDGKYLDNQILKIEK